MDNQKTKKNNMSSRRDFLNKTGIGLLAGYAFNPSIGLAQSIKTPNTDKYQSFTINTHEWYGDIEERLDFPKDWEINYIKMAGHDTHVLTGDEIRRRVQAVREHDTGCIWQCYA